MGFISHLPGPSMSPTERPRARARSVGPGDHLQHLEGASDSGAQCRHGG